MNASRSAYADYEVVDLLADDPELLAIADAVAATQPRPGRRRRWPQLAALAAVVAVVVTTGLAVMPQRGGDHPFLADALAAIGRGPVLHARIEARLPETHVIELATGRAVPQTISIEYWFDESSARLATVVRRGGVPIARFLATPAGTVSDAGSVRTIGSACPRFIRRSPGLLLGTARRSSPAQRA